uniref:Putative rna polymerase ii c-terminal domain-binding protein ra4 n=1 Tax=Lutzomyia longipalpis TaxID=7200 RepID=A0A7G3AYH6_LUTLO
MESVVAFNAELSGLIETKPPISKAKMGAITRAAMKAIKFYKHVVQSVEKFILKCKPEYKVPGLYVIDAIVRQSRHQFGPEKDVFAPRFAQNMQQTFSNLFRCTPEDKSKIVRVLNLWLKNNVFSPEVINPLFDFFNPNRTHPLESQAISQSMNVTNGMTSTTQMVSDSPQVVQADEQSRMSADLSNSHGNVTGQIELDPNIIRQLHHFQKLLIQQTGNDAGAGNSSQDQVKFNKKLLDFDYGEDEEEEKTSSPNVTSSSSVLEMNSLNQLLQDPNVLRQLQNLQKLKQHELEEKQTKLTEMRLQEEAFEKHLVNVLKKLPFASECDLSRQPEQQQQTQMYAMQQAQLQQAQLQQALQQQQQHLQQQQMAAAGAGMMSGPIGTDAAEADVEFAGESSGKVEVITLDGNDSDGSTPDRDRYKSRRRSRSRSRDRTRDRRRRTRSRSRSPRSRRRSSRERARDKKREKEEEYDRERRRKGLPDIKKEHLSVCSTTLWVGHLSKLVQQEELSDTFGRYGDIVSIDMIVPRGCAFIAMNRRQDAYRAMNNLKGHKMQGRVITISWATGKGVKSKEWKDYWDLDLGVSYIPWSKIDHTTDLISLEEGGMFDEDTLPEWLKEKRKNELKRPEIAALDTSQPPPGAMMPIVAPFQLPTAGAGRMIAPPLLPNIIPGLPLGVPPPQMMMTPLMQIPQMDKTIPPPGGGALPTATPEQLFTLNFPMPPMPLPTSLPPPVQQQPEKHDDDHMEIEDDEGAATGGVGAGDGKKDTPLSEQLMAMSNFFNRPPPLMSQPVSPSIVQSFANNTPDKKQQQDEMREDSRDREFRSRGRDRDRERGSRDRDRRGGDYNRGDRGSRWGSGERTSRERTEKAEATGKSLADRLREMANESSEDTYNRRDAAQWRNPQPLMSLFGDQGPPQGRRGGGDGLLETPGPIMMSQGAPPSFRQHDMFDGMRHRDGRMDDFDRRGPNHRGDFFPPPRFGPMNGSGMRGMIPMGRTGGGPQFGPRGGPLFMRGIRPGPPGPGFQYGMDRPGGGGGYFDREPAGGFDRDDRRRNGPGQERRMRDQRGGNRFQGRGEMKQQQHQQQRESRWEDENRHEDDDVDDDEGPPGVSGGADDVDDLPEVGEDSFGGDSGVAAAQASTAATQGIARDDDDDDGNEDAPVNDGGHDSEAIVDDGGAPAGKATPLYDEPQESSAPAIATEEELPSVVVAENNEGEA